MVLLIISNGTLPSETAHALSYDVVISQVYGGGGNSGAPYTHDFVELFNRVSSAVSLTGWSIQYTSATSGKVILANTPTGLACNGSSTPCSTTDLEKIVDLVGFGSTNFYEGSGPAPAGSNTAALLRANSGCREYDDNQSDFATGTPLPRNSSSPAVVCTSIAPVGTGTANPNSLLPNANTLLTVAIRPGDYPPSSGLSVSGDLSSIAGSS